MGEYKGGQGGGKEVEERRNKNTFYLINKAKMLKRISLVIRYFV